MRGVLYVFCVDLVLSHGVWRQKANLERIMTPRDCYILNLCVRLVYVVCICTRINYFVIFNCVFLSRSNYFDLELTLVLMESSQLCWSLSCDYTVLVEYLVSNKHKLDLRMFFASQKIQAWNKSLVFLSSFFKVGKAAVWCQ